MGSTARLLAVVLALLLLAACGGDEPEVEETEEAASSQALDIEIRSTGDRFEYVSPDEIEAGVVEMTVTNSTELFLQAQLVKVEGDHTPEEVIQAITSDEPSPDWVSTPGGVVYVHAGDEKSATVEFEEGTYYLTDTDTLADSQETPSGAQESPGAGGESEESPGASPSPTLGATASASPGADEEESPLLSSLGLVKKLEVTAGDGGGEFPEADRTITATEYAFEVPELKAGTTTIEFDNAGEELHHVIAFPLLPDATSEDIDTFVKGVTGEAQPTGPPPFDFASVDGVAVIDGGKKLVTEIELKEGKYALMCFLTDAGGGPPHVALGMVEEITVSS